MRADFGGSRLTIAHLPRRRARAHLFTGQGRGLLIVALAAAALIGIGLSAGPADGVPSGLTPYAFIGG